VITVILRQVSFVQELNRVCKEKGMDLGAAEMIEVNFFHLVFITAIKIVSIKINFA
jgi:hypothetical protein